MTAETAANPGNQFAWAAAIGGLVFLLLAALLLDHAARDVNARSSAAIAQDSALTLARLAQSANADRDAPARLAMAAERIVAALPIGATARIINLDTRTLIASTDPEDRKLGPAPRALAPSEKTIFDRGRALGRAKSETSIIATGANANGAVVAIAGASVRTHGKLTGAVEVSAAITKRESATELPAPTVIAVFALALAAFVWTATSARRRVNGVAFVALGCAVAFTAIGGLGFVGDAEVAANLAIGGAHTALLHTEAAVRSEFGWLAETSSPSQPAKIPFVEHDASSLWYSLIAASALGVAIGAFIGFGAAAALWRVIINNRTAYIYLAPAMIGMLVLSIFPFLYGVSLSVTNTTLLNQDQAFAERFVGFANYAAILGDFDVIKGAGANAVIDYANFYWTLGITIAWTLVNVAIGIGVGLALALLLNIKGLRGAGIYRSLLILPWAIPNYITALTWKGIFHPQFGSANQVVQAFGGDPIGWFDSVWPSFLTGVITNGWLSFPFMMIVCLGALQAIDEDMYESARIDGASPWQRFRHITLPSLMPALVPAVIVSVIWTFNMFNVIYLVSGGQPSGSTEILVTRAYKVAFEEYRYGYAAAYSVVIFALLLIYSTLQVRSSRSLETAR